MQLSTKGRYAVMALAELAKEQEAKQEGAQLTLAAIAARQQISLSYLEQLFLKLRRAGLVTSIRGPGGGYKLARETQLISIAEIMAAVDEPIQMTRCAEEVPGGCVKGARCLTHNLWHQLSDHIFSFLQASTLEDVMSGKFSRARFSEASEAVNQIAEVAPPHISSPEFSAFADQASQTAKGQAETGESE